MIEKTLEDILAEQKRTNELLARIADGGAGKASEPDADLAGDDEPAGDPEITLSMVQDEIRRAGAISDAAKAKVVKILAKYDARRGSELKKDDYAAAHAEIEKIKK